MIGNFGTGMLNEMLGKANRDGVSAFNLENLMGTALHIGIGLFGAWGIRKLAAPKSTNIFSKMKTKGTVGND